MFEVFGNKLSEDGVVFCMCDHTNCSWNWILIDGVAAGYCYDNRITINDHISITIEGDKLYLVFCNTKKYYGPNIFGDLDPLTSNNNFIIDEMHKLYQLCVDIRNFVRRIQAAFDHMVSEVYSYKETEKIDRRLDITFRRSELQIDIVYYYNDRIQFLPKNIAFNVDSDFLERPVPHDMASSLIHQFSDKIISYRLPNKSARN